MGVATNLRLSRSERNLQSDDRRKQTLRGEFNNLRLLEIIPDTENKSISIQNIWARGRGFLFHTKYVQAVHYIYIYIGINIKYCNVCIVQFMGK